MHGGRNSTAGLTLWPLDEGLTTSRPVATSRLQEASAVAPEVHMVSACCLETPHSATCGEGSVRSDLPMTLQQHLLPTEPSLYSGLLGSSTSAQQALPSGSKCCVGGEITACIATMRWLSSAETKEHQER
jgi:hypothetical protein